MSQRVNYSWQLIAFANEVFQWFYTFRCTRYIKVNVKYVINRLWHAIFHMVPGISLRCRAWYGSLGLIRGPIWKMSCNNLLVIKKKVKYVVYTYYQFMVLFCFSIVVFFNGHERVTEITKTSLNHDNCCCQIYSPCNKYHWVISYN